MAGREKRVLGKIKLPKLGKRDPKVNPLEEDVGTQQNSKGESAGQSNTVSKQVENKMTERELKKMREVEEERMKAIDKDNRRMKRRMLRKQVRKDIVQTTTESCATFCFVFVVGSILLGGGTALIISGKENDVFDFIVVGATGLVCGIIFTVTGLYLFFRPLYVKHKERKSAQKDSWGVQNTEVPTKPYINKDHALALKSEIHDPKKQKRRPSNAELYGDDSSFDNVTTMTTPRDESFTSYSDPPHLAVPNNERESFRKKPVLLLDAKEPMSPETMKNCKKSDSSIQKDSANISYENETNDKSVRFSPESNVVLYSKDDPQLLNGSKLDETDNRGVDDDIDALLRHSSRNTVVIDYSLLKDLETPPQTPEIASTVTKSAADQFPTSYHHDDDMHLELDAPNRAKSAANNEVLNDSDLTEKLHEKHPEIADKHKKRSKKRRKHSEKVITQQSQSQITVPLEESELEDVESMC